VSRALIACGAALLLVACGEKPQGIGAGKLDAPSYSGTGQAYAEKGWKQGDKASWESQLRARAQNGQNDYSKAN
jgi:major membrane immunogen (membrane-anchored lipoprotein)